MKKLITFLSLTLFLTSCKLLDNIDKNYQAKSKIHSEQRSKKVKH